MIPSVCSRSTRALALAGLLGVLAPAAVGELTDWSTGRTLRLDYHHGGTASEEHVGAVRLRLEGEWPGGRGELVDTTNLGKYRCSVVDVGTGRTLYSRGFSSIFGEWETTGEARRGVWRTFAESCRFPQPRGPFQVVLHKRGDDGLFRELFASERLLPEGRGVDRSPLDPRVRLRTLFESGPVADTVDLLILGDGYPEAAVEAFFADAERLTGALFDTEPFARLRERFNVRAAVLPADEAGISDPRAGLWRRNPLGLTYNVFDSGRYVLTLDEWAVREVAAAAPYDALAVLFHGRKYGGGGIYNLYATFPSDSGQSPYLFVHEFGHSFAGLGDEYYTSQVSYEEFVPPGVEPWEPNLTALLDPDRLKWRHLVEPSTPLPTPWGQERYDAVSRAFQERRAKLRAAGAAEEEVEALFQEVRETTGPMLAEEPYFGAVGAFQGAGYQAQGLYRPAADCIMFTRNPHGFCPVCAAAIETVVDLHTHGAPATGGAPEPRPRSRRAGRP